MDFNHLDGARRVPDFDPLPDASLPDPAGTKRDLRKAILSARRSLAVDVRAGHDAAVRDAARAWLAGYGSGGPPIVAAYVPMPGEPGGAALPAALAPLARQLLLPIVEPDRDLDWAAYDGGFTRGRLGIEEPAGARLGVHAIAHADVVIVPAVAVDRRGARLGRGGGSYDRALPRVGPDAVILAALYPGELVDQVPVDAHDHPVHGVIMSGRVIIF